MLALVLDSQVLQVLVLVLVTQVLVNIHHCFLLLSVPSVQHCGPSLTKILVLRCNEKWLLLLLLLLLLLMMMMITMM